LFQKSEKRNQSGEKVRVLKKREREGERERERERQGRT
jgi:hypothetical protein